MSILDFDLMVLTPYHFLSQLFATGVIISSDQKDCDKDISERTLVKVRAYAQYFCDLLTENYHIMAKYNPSKVAASCLYIARKCCQLKNLWAIDIEDYTAYSLDEIADIIYELEQI